MGAYWRRILDCGRDVQLMLVYALLSFFGLGITTLIYNLYLVRLGYDEAFIGAFNAVLTLSMGATCLALGFLINRFGTWTCLIAGAVQFSVTALALAFVTDGPALLVLAALNGIGGAFIQTAQMPFVIEWTPERHRATIAALSSALNSASIMVGSLVGGLLPGLVGVIANVDGEGAQAFRWTLVVGVVLSLASITPMLLMGEARHRPTAAMRMASTQLPDTGTRRNEVRRDLIAVVLIGLFLAFGVGTIEPFYNVLLEDMGTPTASIGIIFAVSGLITTIASIGAPPLAQRIGLVTAQVWIRLMHVPVHLALIVFPTPAIVSLAYASRRVSGSMGWPLESAHVGGLLPQKARPHAFGLRSASWNFGYAVAAFASGQAIARTGSYLPAYISLTVFCILSALVYVVNYGKRMPPGWERPEAEGAAHVIEATAAAPIPMAGSEPPVVSGEVASSVDSATQRGTD